MLLSNGSCTSAGLLFFDRLAFSGGRLHSDRFSSLASVARDQYQDARTAKTDALSLPLKSPSSKTLWTRIKLCVDSVRKGREKKKHSTHPQGRSCSLVLLDTHIFAVSVKVIFDACFPLAGSLSLAPSVCYACAYIASALAHIRRGPALSLTLTLLRPSKCFC